MSIHENLSRRDFLKMGALGSVAFLEACHGLNEADIEKLPAATIEEIKSNPEKFAGLETLRTSGYVSDLGEKYQKESITGPVGKYNWAIIKSVHGKHNYRISSQDDMGGQVLEAVSETKMVNFDTSGYESEADLTSNQLKTKFPEAVEGLNYTIIGRVLKSKDDKGLDLFTFQIARLDKKEKVQ